MKIKNKLFPYPVLHHDDSFNKYSNCTYEFSYILERNEENLIIKDVYINLNSNKILELINKGFAKAVCVIECPLSMYRQTFEISETPRNIEIPLFNLSGKIEISSFIYALKDIKEFNSDEFIDDYSEYDFSIDKNCILAIDNGFQQRIDFESINDTKKSSIFVLVSDLDENSKFISWTYDECLIKITVPQLQHKEYESLKHVDVLKNTFLNIFVVTPLSFILSDFVESQRLIDELEYEYKWFRYFNNAYEKTYQHRLNDEDFLNMDKVKIYNMVQEIFEYCSIKCVDDLFSLATSGQGGSNED